MNIQGFLRQLGVMFRKSLSHPWRQAYFAYDAIGYICGKEPEFELSDYLDEEGYSYYDEKIFDGNYEILWAGADKGHYGFRVKEEYAWLPSYSELLKELAKIYGGEDNTYLQEIESLEQLMENGTLEMEGGLAGKRVVKAIMQICDDFFVFAGNSEKNIINLLEWLFTMLKCCEHLGGVWEWKLISIESPAIDAWLCFLHREVVTDQDRRRSKQVLSLLMDTPITLDNGNDEIILNSHESTSPCFKRPCKGTAHVPFSLTLMQNLVGTYDYGEGASFFWFGLVNPQFLAAMLDVKEFLEKMDEKYHFYLSSGGY